MAQATMFRSRSPLTNEQIAQYAPSVFAAEAHESRGERYAYIPTSNVLEGLRNEGFLPMAVGQTRVRDNGKREHTKHLIRFRQAQHVNLVPGQEVPEIVLVNSHDGTSSYNLMGGIYRVVCSNGLIVGDTSSEVRLRHSGRDVISGVIEGSYRVIEDIKAVAPRVEEFKALVLDPRQQLAFAEAALDLRWDRDEQGNSAAPINPEQMLNLRRWEDKGSDLWRVFNKVQENMIRGGLRGVGATGRRTSTRAVASVSENIKLNKALWTLTDRMASILSGAAT
jgi:hypothetical protein